MVQGEGSEFKPQHRKKKRLHLENLTTTAEHLGKAVLIPSFGSLGAGHRIHSPKAATTHR
jgi:hypothetical protein